MDRGFRSYYDAFVDYPAEIVSFQIWAGTKLVGYQRYDWRGEKKVDNRKGGKYYTYVQDGHRQLSCWGTRDNFGHGPLFITEGIWDAVRIKNCYHDALAVFTNNPHKQLKQWLRMYAGSRPIVAICDNDAAGTKLGNAADLWFKVPLAGHDMNDMTDQEAMDWLDTLLERNGLRHKVL
jgi:hypothetical protein